MHESGERGAVPERGRTAEDAAGTAKPDKRAGNRISNRCFYRSWGGDRNDPCSSRNVLLSDPKRVSGFISGRIRYGYGPHPCEKYGGQGGPERRISNRMRKHPALLWRSCEAAIPLFSSNHKGRGSDPVRTGTSGSRFLCSCMRGKMVGDRQGCKCGKNAEKPWKGDPALQPYGEKSTSETSKSFI